MFRSTIASTLYPSQSAPYYIVAPPYRRSSAGVRALHLLCNYLNQIGQKAYIALSGNAEQGVHPLHPRLTTPILSKEIDGFWRSEGIEPIVVYPEIVSGNPLGAKRVVRYLLYYAGFFGGQRYFSKSDMIISYSEAIRRHYGGGTLLMLPTADPSIFHPPLTPVKRIGTCFYAVKNKNKSEQVSISNEGAIEITQDYPTSVQELADLLRRSEIFIAYGDTGLSLEAALCGCPAVQLFGKDHFEEFGQDGFAFSMNADDIARAKETVHKVQDNYRSLIVRFENQLEEFIETTQRWPAHPL